MSQTPLSELLAESTKVIQQVMAGQSLSSLIPAVDDRYRAGVQALSFFGLRHWNRGLALSDQLLSKKAPNPLFKSLLSLSLILLSAEDFGFGAKEDLILKTKVLIFQVTMPLRLLMKQLRQPHNKKQLL